VLRVGRHEGVGLHGLLSIPRLFPRQFGQVIFFGGDRGQATSRCGAFRGPAPAGQRLAGTLREGGLGLTATSVIGVENVPVAAAEDLCRRLAKEYPRHIGSAAR